MIVVRNAEDWYEVLQTIYPDGECIFHFESEEIGNQFKKWAGL